MNFAWVIGAGGLLGQAVVNEIRGDLQIWSPSHPIRWDNEECFRQTVQVCVQEFADKASNCDWHIFWCAGIGTNNSSERVLQFEYRQVEFFVDCLASIMENQLQRGSFFYSSSAGGIYGDSSDLYVTEQSDVCFASKYGETKFAIEKSLESWSSVTNCRVVIGRITNLVGVGQNVKKGQGLISVACGAMLRHEILEVYVPLQTVRNYIHADDAAKIIVNLCKSAAIFGKDKFQIKIVASPFNRSISEIVRDLTYVFGRRPLFTLSSKGATTTNSGSVAVKSVFLKEVEPRSFKSPLICISEVRTDLVRKLQNPVEE